MTLPPPSAPATPSTPWPRPSYAWMVVAILVIANAIAIVDRVGLALLVKPIEADLGIQDDQMALLQGFAFSIFYAVVGLPLGLMIDRANRRRVLAAGIFLWSLATTACGFAGSFVHLFLARIGVGVGEATLNPGSVSLISDLFQPDRRSRALGIFVIGSSIGTGLAFVLGGAAIDAAAAVRGTGIGFVATMRDWQIVFLLIGAPGLLVALVFYLLVREPVRRDRLDIAPGRLSLGPAFRYMREHPGAYLGLMLGAACNVLSIYAIIAWYPSVFIRVHHWTPQLAGYWVGVVGPPVGLVSGAAGGFIISWLAKRGNKDAPVLLALVVGPVYAVLGAAMCLLPVPGWMLAAYAGTAIVTNWSTIGSLVGLSQVTPNELRGQVIAINTFLVGLISQGLGPAFVGILNVQAFGADGVDKSLALVIALAGIISFAILTLTRAPFRRAAAAAEAWSGTSEVAPEAEHLTA